MKSRKPFRMAMFGAPLALLLAAFAVACSNDDANANHSLEPRDPSLFGQPGYMFEEPDYEFELTAAVTDWEVIDGEVISVWTYNGQYPGPVLRVEEGKKVRVTLINELPESTTIHWHGLDVPNDQDGVPGVTQPAVEPGETWTYEFVPDRVGTTAYHAHAHTVNQLGHGLFGTLIVEDPSGPAYDQDAVIQLHEIAGFYTINGRAYPATLDHDVISVTEGERIRLRFVNMGNLHHPMHLHGHQMKVIAHDGNPMPFELYQNTVDIAPGQTIDVEILADNPGTWMFHCHVITHVANRGEYPGGMLTILDYSDHTSYMEEHGGHDHGNGGTDNGDSTPTEPANGVDAGPEDGVIEIVSNNSIFDKTTIEAPAGEEITIRFVNNDPGIPHNVAFYETSAANNPIAVGELFPGIETRDLTFTVPGPGTYFFKCDVHPTTMVGTFIAR